jgi:hypothetical protein
MKRKLLISVLFGLLVLVLNACAPISNASGGIPTGILPTTPQDGVTQAPASLREAQVQSVAVQYSMAEPVQAWAIVRGNLNESCATLAEPQVSYSSNTFQIKVLTSSPSDGDCIQVTTSFEQAIPLDITNLAQGNYTVIANGVTTAFTIPAVIEPIPTPFQLVVYDSNHNIQVVDLRLPGFGLNPYFNGLIPQGASARGEAYVLDSTNGTKAVLVDASGIHDLSFIERPTLYGLVVYQESADTQPRLAWGTEYTQASPNSTLEIGSVDGSDRETLLTQEVSEPLLQLVPLFWSIDGKSLYFSKEPVGLGGYILFGGASNLYRIDVKTKEVSELIPLVPSDGPQDCLDTISKDYRYVAEHCSEDFIRIRDLTSGDSANILLPDDFPSEYKHLGSSRFSPDGTRIAYAIAKGDSSNEQGWVVVSDTAVSNSKVILTSQAGSYFTVAGWLNDQTLLVQSTNMQSCSPYCSGELWMVDINGANPHKVADGSFITVIPYGTIPNPLPTAMPIPTTAACKDSAEYIRDDGLDGTTYAPNVAFTKTWTVKNTGTCTWDSSYLVYQISGSFMTQQPGYWLVPQGTTVEPGQTVDIHVGMTSPPMKGSYKSYWGLKNEDGEIVPIEGGADGNSFYVEINVQNGSVGTGAVTAKSIDIVPEQGSGDACTADSTYFVHAYISTDGPTAVSYEIGSTAGQIPAGYFEDNGELSYYVTGSLVFDQAGTKTVNLRLVGPYPLPDDITVNLRVNDGEWINAKLYCP